MPGDHEAPSTSRAAGAITLTLLTLALGSLYAMFIALERIPNDPESFDTHFYNLNLALLVAGGVLIAALACGHVSTFKPLRAATRFTLTVLVINTLLWFAPVPFGMHRYLLAALVLLGGGLFGLASLHAAWVYFRGPGYRRATEVDSADAPANSPTTPAPPSPATQPPSPHTPRVRPARLSAWAGPIAVLAMTAAASTFLLFVKAAQVGWSHAND
ncbi:MAG: hypothetical protein H7Y88_03780 [Phycisphaerales bacterium]|nr:hypothetical protein [Phycisphaerales bacterium]